MKRKKRTCKIGGIGLLQGFPKHVVIKNVLTMTIVENRKTAVNGDNSHSVSMALNHEFFLAPIVCRNGMTTQPCTYAFVTL